MKKKLFLILSALFVANSVLAATTLNTKKLEKNIASCSDAIKSDRQKDIEELKNSTPKSHSLRVIAGVMTETVELSNSKTCSIGLLDNATSLLRTYLNSGADPFDSKNELAKTLLMRASFDAKSNRAGKYQEADGLTRQYLLNTKINADEAIASPYYFAAHNYICAAELTQDSAKLMLLDKAIGISQDGKKQKMSASLTAQLDEPIGMALSDKAKYYKATDNKNFAETMDQSIAVFKKSFESGDNLAAYNLAANYAILNDAENTKKWLTTLEEKKGVGREVCERKLSKDKAMAWFRADQEKWLSDYTKRNCSQFAQPK